MKSYLLIISITLTLALSGCIKDDYDEPNDDNKFGREWYELVKTDTLNIRQLTQEVNGTPLPLGSSLVRNSFLYHSLYGSDTITLSGAVCWPVGTDCHTEIWLESHYLTTRWNQCPSQQGQPGMIVCAMRNAIYIGADYQGLGLSRNLDQPYLNTILLASQNIDCYKAAMTLIKEYGPDVVDNYSTYNIGYSLGGAVSMAIARQIEHDPELMESMHLKKTLCGGGPYDQEIYLNYFFENPSMELTYPIAFLCAIKSIISSSPSFRTQYDLKDLFSDKLLNSGIYEALCSKNYDTDQINLMLHETGCESLETIFSPQFLDHNSQIKKDIFIEIAKLDITDGWTPRIPILVRHSKTDTYVPFVCMERVMDLWADNPNFTYDIIESAEHKKDGSSFYKNVIFNNYPLD